MSQLLVCLLTLLSSLGSTVAITDDSGNVTDRVTDPNGLLQMRARYYSPYLCRFVSEDPAGFAGGMNFYAYADGNPVSFLDPFGFGKTEPSSGFWQQYIAPIAADLTSRYRDDMSPIDNLNYNAAVTAQAGLEYLGNGIKNAETATLGPDGLLAFGPAGGLLEEGVMALRGLGALSRGANTETMALQRFYPVNNGFAGATERTFLMPGQTIDRYGGSGYSRFFSPAGTPDAARALPFGTAGQPLRTFEVVKPFEVQSGTVAPWFNQPGGGMQYVTPVNLETLLKRGILK